MRPIDYSTDALPEIVNLRLRPFTTKPHCTKCNSRLTVVERLLWRTQYRLFGTTFAGFNTHYCLGGVEPEIEIPLLGGTFKGQAVCAGVVREHLHIQCQRCNAVLLMETAQ